MCHFRRAPLEERRLQFEAGRQQSRKPYPQGMHRQEVVLHRGLPSVGGDLILVLFIYLGY